MSKSKNEKSEKSEKSEKNDPSKQTYQNPHREGTLYAKGFEILRQYRKKSFTKSFMIEEFAKIGLTLAGFGVMFSPTKNSERGDCRGNRSSAGHVYYIDHLKKVEGAESKFKFVWRPEIMTKLRDDLKANTETEAVEVVEAEATQAVIAESAESNEVSA